MSDDENFNSHNGNSSTFPMIASELRINGHVVLKGRPCKIVESSTSKTGKHGQSKIHLIGFDIFTGKKIEDICPSSHTLDVPIVHREEYQLDGVDNGYLVLADNNGNPKNDIYVPDGDLGQRIMECIDSGDRAVATIVSAMDEQACVSVQSGK